MVGSPGLGILSSQRSGGGQDSLTNEFGHPPDLWLERILSSGEPTVGSGASGIMFYWILELPEVYQHDLVALALKNH